MSIQVLVVTIIVLLGSFLMIGYNSVMPGYIECVKESVKNVTCHSTCQVSSCILKYENLTYSCNSCSYPSVTDCIYLPYGYSTYSCSQKDEANEMITVQSELDSVLNSDMLIPNAIVGSIIAVSVVYIIICFYCCCKKKKPNAHGDDVELVEK